MASEASEHLTELKVEQAPEKAESPKEGKKGGGNSKDERICLICGDRANGVHYNVLSCEGCKSFFLRSAKSKAVFTCSQGSTCSMDLYTRRHCPACRMDRCKELGMSLDRVWDPERLKTRKQLVRVKRKKKMPPSSPPPAKVPAMMEPIPTSSDLPVSPGMVTTCLPQAAIPVTIAYSPQMPPTPMPPTPSPVQSPKPAAPFHELTDEQRELLIGLERGYTASKEVFKNVFPRAGPVVGQDKENGSSSSGTIPKQEPGPTLPPDLASLAGQTLPPGLASLARHTLSPDLASLAGTSSMASASAIVDAQLQQLREGGAGMLLNDPGTLSSSLRRVTSFITNGSMNMMQQEGRPQLQICKELLHIAMDMFAILVKQTIHFAKTIPGFMNLTCDDQAVLIKASIIDLLLLRCAESYAPDKDCLINDMNGDLFTMNMLYQLGYTTLPEPAFQFMRETKACGLTTAEFALLNGVAILSPDRTELRNRELVEQMQQNLILTLYQSTKVYHSNDKTLFARLIMKLTTLRDIAVVHLSDLMEVKVREGDLSPLIVELFGLDQT